MHAARFVPHAAAALICVAVVGSGGQLRAAPRDVAAIENDLVADDPAVRAKAPAELADRFPDGAVAVPMLVDLLDDESPEVVSAAAKSIDALALQAVPQVAAFCSERDGSRIGKLRALVTSMPHGLFDQDPDEPLDPAHAACAAVLATIHWFEATALGRFRSSTGTTRTMTAAALVLFGAEALTERGIAPVVDARRAAAGAALVGLISSSEPASAIAGARLAERLRDESPEVVAALAGSLSADRIVPKEWNPLREGVVRYDRMAAADALAAIGAPAASAAPSLVAPPPKRDRRRAGP